MRQILATDGRIALTVPLDSDPAAMAAGDGLFDVDPDDRPQPPPVALSRASVVDASGELLGVVSWHQVGWGRTRACAAWNVGIALLPAARGRRAGVGALALVARHLFATTDLDRVEAATDVDNLAANRALLGAGFQREGVVRGAQLRAGVRRDLVLYGFLRSDLD
ncbi:probable acetyltransferase [Alloactinosynnema sp. L-07]|uniref:GNAT family N-acetyltransferase n=1 Tax=Alloactinosynnema sp. L-07 TaxID=1653480 RepID=UPI00065EF63C|nr:GNAT family protein [Alloactinosynnema sp. L-07]CRK59941.1 probable acetyltransferase [Alloactinosynnema sp. L-07]